MLVHIVTYISKWNIIEKNTDYPLNRFKTFDISNNIGIPTVLYMKPILQGITIQDIDLYKQIIGKFSIKDVVIGSIFKENLSDLLEMEIQEQLWLLLICLQKNIIFL